MAKSESSARIVTSIVAVISAAALAVSLIAARLCGVRRADVSTKALASVYSTDDASPFTKDELVAAAVQTKHYTVDDNDKAAVYATIAAINAQEALAGTAGKGAPKIDATANYAPASFLANRSRRLRRHSTRRASATCSRRRRKPSRRRVRRGAGCEMVASCRRGSRVRWLHGYGVSRRKAPARACACRCGRFRFGSVRAVRGVGCYRFRRLLRAIPLAVLRGRHMDFQLGFFAHLHVPA